MYQDKRILAIIPARSGSKGLPGKNIKALCGKPLIAWSIEAGLASKYVDEVMVTTDSRDIADIAEKFGANVPFLRPEYLASDTATSFDAIKHTIDFYRDKLNQEFDYIVLLEPTSPLRDENDVDKAIEHLMNHPYALSIVGISQVESAHPAFLVRINQDEFLEGILNKDMKVFRRQELEKLFFFEGSVYISELQALLENKTFYFSKTIGYQVPKWKSFEIDDLTDFYVVEKLMGLRERGILK